MFGRSLDQRETIIRKSLLEQLKQSVQSLIYGPGGENIPRLSGNSPRANVIAHNDNTNNFCNVIEVIILTIPIFL